LRLHHLLGNVRERVKKFLFHRAATQDEWITDRFGEAGFDVGLRGKQRVGASDLRCAARPVRSPVSLVDIASTMTLRASSGSGTKCGLPSFHR